MARKDLDLTRMSALDEALRSMMRSCPAPRKLRSIAILLAASLATRRERTSEREPFRYLH